MTVIRVLVADDQKVVRDGLCALLGLLPGIEVIGAAVDGADAIRQVRRHVPDVVLMDLHMPNCDGVEATRQIVRDQPSVRVVALTAYSDDERVFGALGARAALAEGGEVGAVEADGLTQREVDVLAAIAAGLSNAEIAGRLRISQATVKTHVNHLLAKTGMRDRAQLVGYAFRRDLAR